MSINSLEEELRVVRDQKQVYLHLIQKEKDEGKRKQLQGKLNIIKSKENDLLKDLRLI